MRILAIDPGPQQSAFVVWNGKEISEKGIRVNKEFLEWIDLGNWSLVLNIDVYVLEDVEHFGMPVGKDVFETVRWTGIFAHAAGLKWTHFLPRREVKLHLCGSARAKDANIRQALIERLGPPGTKKAQGITYGVKKDMWSALALAVTWWDQHIIKP